VAGVVLWLVSLAAGLHPAVALPNLDGWYASPPSMQPAGMAISTRPSLEKRIHRLMTRTEHSTRRFATLLGSVGLLWLRTTLSAAVFLGVAAFSSVADLRMLSLRHEGRGALSRYLGYGMRTFFRLLRDRRTPFLARSVLAMALLYWLVPFDLLRDNSLLPGFLDDIVVAVSAAKGFMYLCPDALVDAHAADIESQAHASLT